MADTSTLDADITEALAELRGARDAYTRSPNADNQLIVEYAEKRLDRLLGRRSDLVKA